MKLANAARPLPGPAPSPRRPVLGARFFMEMRGGAGSCPRSLTAAFSRSPLPPPCRAPSPLPPPALPESIPEPGRGERFSAEKTKPAAAMGGELGSAHCGGQEGVPGWGCNPLAKDGVPSSLSSKPSPLVRPPPPPVSEISEAPTGRQKIQGRRTLTEEPGRALELGKFAPWTGDLT